MPAKPTRPGALTKAPVAPVDTGRESLIGSPPDMPVVQHTSIPADRSTRVPASYKIEARIKRALALYVKHLNRDRALGEEIEIAQVVEEAITEYLHSRQWEIKP